MHEIICTCHDADASSMLLQKAQDRLPSVSWNTSEKLIGCASFNEMPRTLGPSWGKCPVSWRGCRAAQSTGGHAASVYGEIQSFQSSYGLWLVKIGNSVVCWKYARGRLVSLLFCPVSSWCGLSIFLFNILDLTSLIKLSAHGSHHLFLGSDLIR